MNKWYNSRINAGLGEVDVFGDIGGYGVYADDLIKEIEALGATRLNVNISSLGGDVNEALQIHDFLRSYKGTVTARITGMTASAGTLIAMGADKVKISENALFLIHNSWSGVVGNADELEKSIETLRQIDAIQSRIYSKKTGRPENEMRALMDEERWLDAEEAVELGFADEILEASKISAAVLQEVYAKIDQHKLPTINTKQLEHLENEINMEDKSKLAQAIEGLTSVVNAYFKKEEAETTETINKADVEASIEAAKTELEDVYKWQIDAHVDTIQANAEAIAEKDAEIETLKAELAKAQAGKVETEKKKDGEGVEIHAAAEAKTGFDLLAQKLATKKY